MLDFHRDHYFVSVLTPDEPEKNITQVFPLSYKTKRNNLEFADMRAIYCTVWR
jgi:hypothetical protein